MPKNRPTIGQTNWGAPLNDHLNSLMPNGGGINFAGTAPTGLVAGDDGYTYVNTTTREIQRWNGTGFDVLLGGVAVGRETLTANRTYYVNNISGNDSNNGLTAGTAFATIAYAVDFVRFRLDPKDFDVTVQLADSATPYVGFSRIGFDVKLTISGNTTTPANVVIDGGLNPAGRFGMSFTNANKPISIKGIKFIDTNPAPQPGFAAMLQGKVSTIALAFCEFGVSASPGDLHQIEMKSGASCGIYDTIYASGGARAHLYTDGAGGIGISGNGQLRTLANVNYQAFAIAFLKGVIIVEGAYTFSDFLQAGSPGLVSGARFDCNTQSTILTGGRSGLNFFPGSIPGVVDGTSLYT